LTLSQADTREQLREKTNAQVVERLRTILWLLLAALPIFAIQELRLDLPDILPLYSVKLAQLAVVIMAFVALRLPRARAHGIAIAVFVMGMLCLTTAASNIVRDDTTLTPLLLIILTMGTATLFPWGFPAQLAVVAIAAVTFATNVWVVRNSLDDDFGYLAVAAGVAFVGSIYVAYEFERYRRVLEERNLALHDSEARHRTLVEELDAIVWEADAATLEFSFVSQRAEALVGYPVSQWLAEPEFWVHRIHPDDRERVQAFWQQAAPVGGEHVCEYRALAANGGVVWLRDVVSVTQNGGARRLRGVMVDITERKLAEQTRDEGAAVSAALAQVGREMIALLDAPQLLQRLCQLTTTLLQCDYSHTWLWDPKDQAYVAAAGYGDPPELWESLRVVKLSRPVIDPLLAQLEHEGIVHLDLSAFQPTWPSIFAPPEGVTAGLMLALRRGDEVFGIHTAGYRGRQRPFTQQQQRIGAGIAQLASMALDNVRLLEKLARADRLKSEFVATMSHELRTPLNIIMGYNHLLLEGTYGPLTPEQVDGLKRVAKSSSDLLDLINETLDLSRLEAGRLQVERMDTDVAELLRDIDVETVTLRDKPAVVFSWNLEPGLPHIHTDALKLKVVLKNLIQNALKFTARGSVTVDAHRCDGGVEFCVADTGIGIAPEAVPIIFEPFRQVDGSNTRRYGGVGLGLYIVRRLLDLLGGTIAVDSTPGHGSVFRVWVPGAADTMLNKTAPDGLAA